MKKISAAMLLLVIAFFASSIRAQATFATVLSTSHEISEYGRDLVQAPDGGFVFTGIVKNPSRTDTDILIGKFSSTGHLVWAKSIGGTFNDQGFSIIKKSGFYYASGSLKGYIPGSQNIAIIKFDDSGTISWVKVVAGTDNDEGQSIINTSDGGFAIGGMIYDSENANDFAILKFDSSDNLQWMNRVGTENHDIGYSVVETGNGKFIVCGFTYGGVSPSEKLISPDIMFAKFSSTGALELAKTVSDSRTETAYALLNTSDNGYVVISEVRMWSFDQSDILISKFNSSDVHQWSKVIGWLGYDAPRRAIRTSDGGCVISGDVSLTRGIQAGILKLNSTFGIEWLRGGGGIETDYGFGVIETAGGGYAQMGSSSSSSVMQLMIIKYNSDGRYCQSDSATPMLLDTTVTYSNISLSENRTPLTIETISPEINNLSPAESLICAGLEIAESELPKSSGLAISPNPFNSTVNISLPSPAKVEIIDINGRLIDAILNTTASEVQWRPSEAVVSGVYLVRAVFSNGLTAEQRVVYLK